MRRQLVRHNVEIKQLFFRLGICFFASSVVLAQPNGTPYHPATHPAEEANKKETTIRGCLGGWPDHRVYYFVADEGGYFYALGGNISLKNYVGKEVRLRGRETHVGAPSRFVVVSVGQVFDAPCPIFKPSFSGRAWHTGRNRKYGIEFSYPDDFTQIPTTESGQVAGNFVTDQGVVPIARLTIPTGVYPNSNFVGGTFAIYVSTEIENGPSCRQFGFSDPQFASSHTVHGIQYSEMKSCSAAAGTSYSDYQLHTCQNSFCYEISFKFREASPYNIEHKIRVLREMDEWNLIQGLIEHVRFSRPAVTPARKNNPQAVPRITSFVASSHTADDVTNRGQITFSWTTQGADYVELSYHCLPTMAGKIPAAVILEGGYYPSCDNVTQFSAITVRTRAPNSSQTVIFGNFHELDPISIMVKLTPYAYGKAYPDSSKSILIRVGPHN